MHHLYTSRMYCVLLFHCWRSSWSNGPSAFNKSCVGSERCAI